jgi:hypothetical protein
MEPPFENRNPLCTVFPAARQTFGDETTWTLENRPSVAISRAARRITPEPETTEYGPAEDFTGMRFIFTDKTFLM